MDGRTMQICYDKIYRPYVRKHDGEAALMLEDVVRHKSAAMKEALEVDNSLQFMICVVGIKMSQRASWIPHACTESPVIGHMLEENMERDPRRNWDTYSKVLTTAATRRMNPNAMSKKLK